MDSPGPHSAAEIAKALKEGETAVSGFIAALPVEAFLNAQPGKWSPAVQLRHLERSVRAVAGGLKLPRLLLRLRFGRARTPSRDYLRLRDDYRALLAAGGRSSAEFTPAPEAVPAGGEEAYRNRLLERWTGANQALREALARWPEDALDRLRMPHPLLGLLTVREMLFFTRYHALHHLAGMEASFAAQAGHEFRSAD
jgi:hypothetical protein